MKPNTVEFINEGTRLYFEQLDDSTACAFQDQVLGQNNGQDTYQPLSSMPDQSSFVPSYMIPLQQDYESPHAADNYSMQSLSTYENESFNENEFPQNYSQVEKLDVSPVNLRPAFSNYIGNDHFHLQGHSFYQHETSDLSAFFMDNHTGHIEGSEPKLTRSENLVPQESVLSQQEKSFLTSSVSGLPSEVDTHRHSSEQRPLEFDTYELNARQTSVQFDKLCSQPGPIPASSPELLNDENTGEQLLSFLYSKRNVVSKFVIRCPEINLSDPVNFDSKFLKENCVYPGAMCHPKFYSGRRFVYERDCNTIGWHLAHHNPSIRGSRGLIQRAVDSWRNTRMDLKLRSRRVRKELRLNKVRQMKPN